MANPIKAAGAELLRDPVMEHIAGSADSIFASIVRSLPQWVDDITRDYGTGTYEKMLTDAGVSSPFGILTDAVMADGVQLLPAVKPPDAFNPGYVGQEKDAAEAKVYFDFCQRSLDEAETPILGVADEMLHGAAYGNKVAEPVLQPGLGVDSGKLVLRAVKPRPRQNVAFVVDAFNNCLGVVGVRPGQGGFTSPILSMSEKDVVEIDSFVPKSQLVMFQWRVRDCDPRGTAILRPAYNPWFMKTRVYPDYYKYLKQFASPSVVGKTAVGALTVQQFNEDGTPKLNPDRTPSIISAESALLAALLRFVNSTALVVPGGTEVQTLFSQGDGEAFLKANNYFDRQMSLAILNTTRLNLEAEHGSRADSGTAQDVSGQRVQLLRLALTDCLNQLTRYLVRVNFGESAVRLAPRFSLAGQEAHDWVPEIKAIADAYGKGYIHDSQLPALDARLGLPPRDMEAIAREKEERANMDKLLAGHASTTTFPVDDSGGEE